MSSLSPDLEQQRLRNRARRIEHVLSVLHDRRLQVGPARTPPALNQAIDDLDDQLTSVRARLRADAARGAGRPARR